jgi:integrase
MSTIKIVLFTSKKLSDGKNPVLLRLTIDRKIKYFSLPDNLSCFPSHWDLKNGQFNNKYPNHQKANKRLLDAQSKAMGIIADLNEKNNDLGFTHDEFAEMFSKKSSKLYLFQYFDDIVERLQQKGKVGNAAAYNHTKNSFMEFFKSESIESDQIEMKKFKLDHLNKYVSFCIKKGHKDTSISLRIRTLRALFNQAKKEEKLENYPFDGFNWRQFNLETQKRAITKTDLLKIYNHKIDPGQPGFDSRNFWMFSYFTFGLNFCDLAKLEPGNIVSDEGQKTLVYLRSKTHKIVKVPLSDEALKIIEYYKNLNFGGKYIFPILNPELHKTPQQIMTRIKTATKKLNDEICTIGKVLEIEKHLTTYVARHSFATILKKELIPTSIISDMMGHKSESVTQTYLDGFSNETKSEAAKKLL